MKIVLAEREAELMQVLWDHGPSTVAEVQAQLKDELAYTTVLTMLQKLEKKGYVRHEEVGREHGFEAAIDREMAQRGARACRPFFQGICSVAAHPGDQ